MDLVKIENALEKKGYKVSIFDNDLETIECLETSIHGMSVGFGGSQTLTSLDLHHRLAKNNRVFVPDFPPEGETFDSIAMKARYADVYLLSANAVSENGEIVNIDMVGNRLASSLFGHKKVFYVVSENKIGGTLEQAVYRARNIAAPKNALGMYRKTPCAMAVAQRLTQQYKEQYPEQCPENDQLQWQKFIEGLTEKELNTHCYDCKSPDRICGSLLIHWIKPAFMEAEVVIIRNNKGF